ncbi:MAG: ion transporter [Flavobacteriaceae bacterium]|nr:ion transporter [Flavobacteriaceae bacterium]
MKVWKLKLHQVLNEADTKSGLVYEYVLFTAILLAVASVALESIESVGKKYCQILIIVQGIILVGFVIEYVLRIIIIDQPSKFIFSFYGIIDLVAILALSSVMYNDHLYFLVVIRSLRFLRVFKVLKYIQFRTESKAILIALKQSRTKIIIFVFAFLLLCTCFGTIMFLIEPKESGFTSIPMSIYWCIVTLTTVGYGDITPTTIPGKFIASLIMLIGYGIIAVSALIVTSEASKQIAAGEHESNTQTCSHCLNSEHKDEARYCHKCGNSLEDV